MDSKLNILFLSSWFPTKDKTTHGNFVKWHAQTISLHSNISLIYVSKTSGLASQFIIEQEQSKNLVISIMYYNQANLRISFLNKLANSYFHFKSYYLLFKQLQHKPDLVHANIVWPIGLFAIWLKLRYKLKFIITEHWSALSKKDNFSFLKQKLISIIFKKASLIIPVSEGFKEDIKKWNSNLEFKVIPNVVNTKYFNFKEKQKFTVFKWAHISTLDPIKNVEGIIKAFSKLIAFDTKHHLSIISDGDYSNIQILISKLQIPKENINLIGISSNHKVANLIKQSDACIQFSHSETFGIVAAESLCTGTPVISTKVGFLKEFYEEEIGLFVKNNNEDDLLKKMKLMPNIAFNNKKCSLYFSSLFNAEKISQTYYNVYKELLKQ